MERIEYRMYGFVNYQLSGIQKGIQFGHAVVDYIMNNMNKPETQEWAHNDKTFIILNGGTTNLNLEEGTNEPKGTLNKHSLYLKSIGVITQEFYEPDLGDQMTAVVFLVPEQVYDIKKYPNQIIGQPNDGTYVYYVPETEEDYTKRLGGEKNVLLRDFIRKFNLA